MIPAFNSIILDVLVVVLLLAILVFGALKGIKHTLINFVLLVASLALAFTPVTNIIKTPLISFLSDKIVLGAGVSDVAKFGMYLSYPIIASFILAILFYALFRLIKVLILLVVKRRKARANEMLSAPTKASRIAGAIFSFILNGVIVVILLSLFAHPLVGGNKTIEKGYVAKHIENLDNMIIESLTDSDAYVEEKVLIKLIKGDVLTKVGQEDAMAFVTVTKIFEKDELIPENLDNVQETLDNMLALLKLVDKQLLNEKGEEVDGFEKSVEMIRTLLPKCIDKMNNLHVSSQPIAAKNTLAITNLLKRVGLEKNVATFESIFVIN